MQALKARGSVAQAGGRAASEGLDSRSPKREPRRGDAAWHTREPSHLSLTVQSRVVRYGSIREIELYLLGSF